MVPEGKKTKDCPPGRTGGMIHNRIQGEGFDKACTELPFAHPPEIDNLDGKHSMYANTTAEDIVKGSLLTCTKNGNKNAGKSIDYNNVDMLLEMTADKLLIPGMYRLPVCRGMDAYKKWKNDDKRTDDHWPC